MKWKKEKLENRPQGFWPVTTTTAVATVEEQQQKHRQQNHQPATVQQPLQDVKNSFRGGQPCLKFITIFTLLPTIASRGYFAYLGKVLLKDSYGNELV